jgi:hypothetical protein
MISHPVSRRGVLHGTGLLLAATITPGWAQDAQGGGPDLQNLAEDAAIWGMPLVQTGRYLELARAKGIKWNQFYLNQTLATPSLHVPGPNIDTIYGFAWLDLASGPVVLDVPDVADRYYSIQLLDAYENTFAYVGRRETGTKAGTYVIAGPGWNGKPPSGAQRIDSPTSIVLALTRTLVRGSADLKAAQDLQAAYTLAPLANYPAGKTPGIVEADVLNILPKPDLRGTGEVFFAELNALVQRFPPQGEEAVIFARFAPLGLGGNFATQPPLPPAALQTALQRALQRVQAAKVTDDNDGWRVNYHITKFIADPVARANVDQFGPGAHIAAEAVYFATSHDAGGEPLTGSRRYTITFAKGQLPPAKAFWSLILYGADLFLVDNPINRYSINDRTEGLSFTPDGELRIRIQHGAPGNVANWLPAPAGAFQLILRTYQPDESVLSGTYKVPPVVRIGG